MFKRFFYILTIVICSGVVLNCSSSDDEEQNNLPPSGNFATQAEILEALLKDRDWVVSYYFHDSSIETDIFNFYAFDFQESNVLESTDGFSIHQGSWNVSFASGSDEEIELRLSFLSPEDFNQISKTWNVIRFSDELIELNSETSSSGDIDILTFRMN